MNSAVKELLIKKENETIFGIIGRMESLFHLFTIQSEFKHLDAFLFTYLAVTKSIFNHVLEIHDFYADFDAMEQLDIKFAWLYFDGVYSFLSEGETPAPWKKYYEYCDNDKSWSFVQILIGINVHINADLPLAILESNFQNKSDYDLVNKVLANSIAEVMQYLVVRERDIMGLGGFIVKDFYTEQFTEIIVKWREIAWKNAMALKSIPESKRDAAVTKLQVNTDLLSEEIAKTWNSPLKLLQYKKLLKSITEMEVTL